MKSLFLLTLPSEIRNIIHEMAVVNPKYVGHVEELCDREPRSHEP